MSGVGSGRHGFAVGAVEDERLIRSRHLELVLQAHDAARHHQLRRRANVLLRLGCSHLYQEEEEEEEEEENEGREDNAEKAISRNVDTNKPMTHISDDDDLTRESTSIHPSINELPLEQ